MLDLLSKLSFHNKDRIATLLKTDKAALSQFEAAYQNMVLSNPVDSDNLFDQNSRTLSQEVRSKDIPETDQAQATAMIDRIVRELTDQTQGIRCLGGTTKQTRLLPESPAGSPVTREEIQALPAGIRPQLTGELISVDVPMANYSMLLENYDDMLHNRNKEARQQAYHLFHQGLDILDLDPVIYEMLSMNPNAMSHWLPAISRAAAKYGFFQIPETRIVKVPMPILQLTRKDYQELTPTTLKIVDDWAMKAFDLDVGKSYFIKTGTYSSKFDFRNCKVTGEKEVRELGEYLLFLHFQACQMASPLTTPCIYGASTTNEWAVREFIEDKENNPCIYKGLPLHTEYRVFVDFDAGEIIGYSPYWEPNMMLKRFSEGSDSSLHDRHDYVIFKAHEQVLTERYENNIQKVLDEVRKLLPDTDLTGQWSIDIMQNGDDFWLIDMATAATSALKECVPPEKLKPAVEPNWLPNTIAHIAIEKAEG